MKIFGFNVTIVRMNNEYEYQRELWQIAQYTFNPSAYEIVRLSQKYNRRCAHIVGSIKAKYILCKHKDILAIKGLLM